MLGATILWALTFTSHRRFQSSPSLGAGSNYAAALSPVAAFQVSILSQLRCWEQRLPKDFRLSLFLVSILSQLRCWEQPGPKRPGIGLKKFQSSPSLGAGSNIQLNADCKLICKFQSSPSLGAGSNQEILPLPFLVLCFNPLPA